MADRDEDERGAFDIPIFTEEFLDHNKGEKVSSIGKCLAK